VLTSVKNPKVAAAIRLKKRTFREEDRRFLVEGAQAVGEALDEPDRLQWLFVTEAVDPLAIRARQRGVDVYEVSHEIMARLTSTVTPQGIVGVAPFLDVPDESFPADGCIVVLHQVRDPGNAGTVVRSADAAGAGGIAFTVSSVDVYNPKTVRSTAGSIFHLPISRGRPTADVLARARRRGYRILAMDADGELDLYRTDLSGPTALVFGNEARGLPPDVLALADASVRVPRRGKAESLNLAAAATVCLFEWARRRADSGTSLETIVAAAAHDIRSPLTAMKGFGYALEKRWDSMTEEQRSMMLRGIVYDADRMDSILRLLIDAARLAAGTLEAFPERVDLPELAASIVRSQRRDPEHPEIRWVGRSDVAMVDAARLRSAILSFVESLAWWAREGAITIDGGLDRDRLRITAWRDGSEIGPDDVEALFMARRPGTGAGSKIGLFVTRGVAEAQGGRAWGEVVDGRLAFHLELPVSTA